MVAAVLATLALLPALPPEPLIPPEPTDPPPDTYIVAGPAEGSSTTSLAASFQFASDDAISYRCTLDAVATACGESYTTPALALATHTITVASRGVGGWDLSPARRSWTVAAVPVPTPTPTPVPTAVPTPVPTSTPVPHSPTPAPTPAPTPTAEPPAGPASPVATATTVPATAVLAAPLPRIDVSIVYFMNAKRNATRFATLSITKVPAGATVKVTCRGGCPRSSQTLSSAKGGTVALTSFRGKALKTGARLTVTVTRPGMTGMAKVLTMRAERRPEIVTRAVS
jgi:hypothetical protein